MVEVTYSLNAEDIRQAMRAYRYAGKSARLRMGLFLAGPIGLFVFLLVLVLTNPRNAIAVNLLPLSMVWLFAIALYLLIPYWSAKKQFEGSPASQGVIRFNASDGGVCIQSEHSGTTSDWATYVRWVENDAVLVLFSSPTVMIVIPVRSFSPDQLAEFKRLLQRKIAPKS